MGSGSFASLIFIIEIVKLIGLFSRGVLKGLWFYKRDGFFLYLSDCKYWYVTFCINLSACCSSFKVYLHAWIWLFLLQLSEESVLESDLNRFIFFLEFLVLWYGFLLSFDLHSELRRNWKYGRKIFKNLFFLLDCVSLDVEFMLNLRHLGFFRV